MTYGLYYCYNIDINEYKQIYQVVQQKQMRYPNYTYKNNMNMNIRKRGNLKQPGGGSCDQRR